jgi:cytochrome c peroxidase
VFTTRTPQDLYILVGAAIAAFENSPEVNQFSSKYDASIFGVPSQHRYTLTASGA